MEKERRLCDTLVPCSVYKLTPAWMLYHKINERHTLGDDRHLRLSFGSKIFFGCLRRKASKRIKWPGIRRQQESFTTPDILEASSRNSPKQNKCTPNQSPWKRLSDFYRTPPCMETEAQRHRVGKTLNFPENPRASCDLSTEITAPSLCHIRNLAHFERDIPYGYEIPF
jgi:hypothetical protein